MVDPAFISLRQHLFGTQSYKNQEDMIYILLEGPLIPFILFLSDNFQTQCSQAQLMAPMLYNY